MQCPMKLTAFSKEVSGTFSQKTFHLRMLVRGNEHLQSCKLPLAMLFKCKKLR